MAREQTTLTGDTAEQFREIREEMGEHRAAELSNAEVIRRLMSTWEKNESSGRF